MNQEKQIPQQTKTRKSLGSLCAVSGLLLSIVCCIALVHVEFRIQEHHQLLSHPTTFCDQIEKEILRKVQNNFKRWAAATDENLSGGKGNEESVSRPKRSISSVNSQTTPQQTTSDVQRLIREELRQMQKQINDHVLCRAVPGRRGRPGRPGPEGSPVAPRVSLSSNRFVSEEGQTITIACSATGQPQPTITWSKSIGSLPSRATVKNGALKIKNVLRRDGGTYICKTENTLGAAEDTIQLMIFSRLLFKVRPPVQLTAATGSPLHLHCVAKSELTPTVTWMKDGKQSLPVDSSILQNNTLVISSVKTSHEGSYTCKATNVVSTIEANTDVKVIAPSCSVIRKFMSSSSGNYVIDPDGVRGLAPFTVYCDMSDKNGVGVTVISHDSESRTLVDGYHGQGDYSRSIHYSGASLSQLASLTDISTHCKQFIKYECYHSVILFSSPYGWWVSRDSSQMLYWGGASAGSKKCACGMTNSCADSSKACNCDKNDGVWREDSGRLTDKSTLPVKELRFGDTGINEKGYHTLGKLKCYGIAHE